MTTQSFRCPSCNASLEYDDSGASTVRCPYCNTTVIVPAVLREAGGPTGSGDRADVLAEIGELLARGRKIEAIKAYRDAFGAGLKEAKEAVEALERGEAVSVSDRQSETSGATARSSRRMISCVAFLLVLAVGVAAAAFLVAVPAGREAIPQLADGPEPVEETGQTTPASTETTAERFVAEVLTVGGEEGTGPGFFNDTRWLGVDGEGNIYTGDFDGGRVQVFDGEGNFITQWFTDDKGYIHALAVSRPGTIFILEAGQGIFRYEGATGELLGPLTGAGTRFEDITVAANGDLVAVERNRLVRFDPAGAVVQELSGLFDNVPGVDGPVIIADIAVDGEDNLYILPVFDPVVYKFNAEGQYVDRFGQEGDGPGDFTAPSAIAVDGQGRVFVDDFSSILVFDPAGRHLDTIDAGGVAFTLLFDTQNNLYRMDRNGNRVIKYELLK